VTHHDCDVATDAQNHKRHVHDVAPPLVADEEFLALGDQSYYQLEEKRDVEAKVQALEKGGPLANGRLLGLDADHRRVHEDGKGSQDTKPC